MGQPVPDSSSSAPPTAWRLRLLGAVEARRGATVMDHWPTRAHTLLLARLALWPERLHPREELVRLIWPGADEAVGRNRLRQALSSLRSLLEADGGPPVIDADRLGLRVRPGLLLCDVLALRRALQRRDVAAVRRLAMGDLLPGHMDDWVADERAHLAAQVQRVLAMPAAALGATPSQGAQPLSLPLYLTRLIGADAARQHLAEAVREHRLVLLRGPGGSGKTRLAVEAARELADDFDSVVFVPLVTCQTRAAMAEAVLASLRHEAGGGAPRGDAHEAVRQALDGRRVLLVLDNFEQLVGVAAGDVQRWLAHLHRLHVLVTSRHSLGLDGEREVIQASLPVPDVRATPEALMANPAVALFLDRAGAARAGFAAGPAELLQAARLVNRLHGLPLAIELAASKLRSLGLAELAELLDGAPSTAAGPLGAPGAGLQLLDRGGPRAGDDPRHASMLAVVRWSLQALAPAERALLEALAVFDGGAPLPALVAMESGAAHGDGGAPPADAARTVARLDELVASSVAYRRDGRTGSRWHVVEPVRDVLLWQLEPARQRQLRQGHARWALAWARACGTCPDLPAVREELPNLLAAWREADNPAARRAVLASALGLRWALDDLTLPGEHLAALRSTLAAEARGEGTADALLSARVQAVLAEQSFERGERDVALQHAEAALAALPPQQTLPAPEALGTPADAAFVAQVLYAVARLRLRVQDDAESASRLVERALAQVPHRAAFDTPGADPESVRARAKLLSLAGVLAYRRRGDAGAKQGFDQQVLALWRTQGPPQRVSEGLVNLSLALGHQRQIEAQLAHLAEAHAIASHHGQTRLLAFVCSVRGYALADQRRWEASITSYRECLQAAWNHSGWREWFYALWNLPRSLAHRRQGEAAARLMGFAEHFAAARFGQLGAADLRERRRTRRLLHRLLGAEATERLWRQGQALEMADAMRLAMSDGVPG